MPSKESLRRLASFGAIGATITAMNYVVLAGLIGLGVNYLAASAVGWAIGLAVSFSLNRRMTFKVRRRISRAQVNRFVAGYILQFLIGELMYWILIGRLGLPLPIAFGANLVVVAAFSYTFMGRFVFPPDVETSSPAP